MALAVANHNDGSPRPRLPPAESTEDQQLFAAMQWSVEGAGFVATDEDAHVAAHPILFIDHPEPKAWIAPVELVHHLAHGGARGLHACFAVGVGDQLRGDGDSDQRSGAATTE